MDYIALEYLEKLLRWMRSQIMQFCLLHEAENINQEK